MMAAQSTKGSITVDDSGFPLVVVTFVGTVTNDEFQAYLDAMAAIFRRKQRAVAILDARRAERTPAIQRQMQAEWLNLHRDELSRYSLGDAFVLDSPVMRGVLTAILWLSPMPAPFVVVKTFEEALEWALGRVRAAGLSAPASAGHA